MKFPIYQIDAFAEELFTGNPAAVVVLKDWLDTDILQKIAAENNLAETAFIVNIGNDYEIRWFTPKVEVDLCGHATLAAGYVVSMYFNRGGNQVVFHSRKSGKLIVEKNHPQYTLDFPVDQLEEFTEPLPEDLISGIGKEPVEYLKGNTDCLLVYEKASDIKSIKPNFCKLEKLNYRGVIVTAPGDEDFDFVSRFFAPQSGIPEDPVTGSAHTTLVPYWANRTGKYDFVAQQLSQRNGQLHCTLNGNRVKISGKVKLYLKGEIHVN